MNASNIKTSAPIDGPQLVAQPELIRVKTISPKISEQLPFIDGDAGSARPVIPWEHLEIIGAIPRASCAIVLHRQTGRISKLRGIAYIMHLMDAHGLTNEAAVEQLRNLPQVFEA